MPVVVILGAVLVAAGLAGLGYCIRSGLRIRRGRPEPEAARDQLNRLLAVNLGSVGLAGFGLALVVIGLVL